MDFGRVLGGQVGAKLAPKSIKMESKMTSTKEVEIKRGEVIFGGLRPVRGVPWEGDIGGGKMDQWIKRKQALYLNTPMGQRPGEFTPKLWI